VKEQPVVASPRYPVLQTEQQTAGADSVIRLSLYLTHQNNGYPFL